MRHIFSGVLRGLALLLPAAWERRQVPVGGQAVIEGVLMRGPERWGLSVRTSEGDIRRHTWVNRPWSRKSPWRLPVFRGVATMAEMLYTGTKALSLSAEISLGEEESLGAWGLALSIGTAILAVVGLFVALPLFAADLAEKYLGFAGGSRHLVEGLVRAGVFIGYIVIIGLWKEIARVFEYHGAEHKTINAYEDGVDITVENVMKYSVAHPRCGTAFLLTLVLLSILVFSLLGPLTFWVKILSRIVLIPVLAMFSYELIRWMGDHLENGLVKLMVKPNLELQKLTTREPDEGMVEVAISSFKQLLQLEGTD